MMDDYQILGIFALSIAFCVLLLFLWTKTDDRSQRAVRASRKAIQALTQHLVNDHGLVLEQPIQEQELPPLEEDEFEGMEEPSEDFAEEDQEELTEEELLLEATDLDRLEDPELEE
jgi:hypothetical protein